MVTDIHAELMNLLRQRLEQFNVPHEIIRQIRDDAIELVSRKDTAPKRGAAVMTAEASMAADKLKNGGIDPRAAKPKIV